MNIEILPTVVPSTLAEIEALATRYGVFAHAFHVDAADGVFAPNKSWMPQQGEKLPNADTFFYEAHLMVAHPQAAGTLFAQAGAKRIIAHAEAFDSEAEAKAAFEAWKAAGVSEIGIALLIDSSLEAFSPYSLWCDSVTVMSIPRIGVQGIPFDERAYGRVADLHARYAEFPIEVDGGVGGTQIATLVRAGATRFSVGSALAQSPDPAKTHTDLLVLAQAAV